MAVAGIEPTSFIGGRILLKELVEESRCQREKPVDCGVLAWELKRSVDLA